MQKYEISVEIDGKDHHGLVTEDKGMVTVTSFSNNLSTKSATFKGNSKIIAELLLREMVNETNGKGW